MESRGGLDVIFGAGMLDNASGSAAILDIAQQLKNTSTRSKLRFIWFGGEELGLLGSQLLRPGLLQARVGRRSGALPRKNVVMS